MSSPNKYDAVLGGGSNTPIDKGAEAKLRIEGKSKAELDAIVQELKQVFEVSEESRDYPNRRDPGVRRYLRVKVKRQN